MLKLEKKQGYKNYNICCMFNLLIYHDLEVNNVCIHAYFVLITASVDSRIAPYIYQER